MPRVTPSRGASNACGTALHRCSWPPVGKPSLTRSTSRRSRGRWTTSNRCCVHLPLRERRVRAGSSRDPHVARGLHMTQRPIADYALLSDCHAAALVGRDGSIDWLCFPRFDSPSVFGHVLDEAAGRWCIRTVDTAEITRAYVPETLVLETTYPTASGV